MKTLMMLMALAVSLILVGCSGRSAIPAAQAQSMGPPAFTLHQDINGGQCPVGCKTESPGRYISMKLGPTTFGQEEVYAYQLPYSMDVGLIENWIGTAQGVTVEMESRLQIQYSDGSWEEFYNEIDKHTDVRDESVKLFNINRHLPVGTLLIVNHSGGYIGPDAGRCLTEACGDTMWKLFSQK